MRESSDRDTGTALAAWAGLAVAVVARTYLTCVAALTLLATVPLAFGLSAILITGNSMRPWVHAGDVVLTAPVRASDPVPLGRVVVFTAAPGSAATGHVLHRIVAVNKDGSLVTAGDANAQYDSAPLQPGNIEATAVVLARWIGLPLYWATTQQYGLLLAFVVLTALALLAEVQGSAVVLTPRRRGPPVAIGVSVVIVATSVALAGGMGPRHASATFTGRAQLSGNAWTYPVANAAVRMAFTASPSNSAGGADFGVQPRVVLLDADGAPTRITRAITLSLTGGTGALSCDENPLTTANGTASFTGCSVDRAGTYTLVASSTGLPSLASGTLTVSVGGPARLAFGSSPDTASVGTAFTTQPVVRILDAGGNLTTSTASVTLTLDNAGSGALTCAQNPKPAVVGVATFSGCSVTQPGTYTLTARTGTLTAATTSPFVVTKQATATTLSSITPSSGTTGTTFTAKATVTGSAGVGTPAGSVVFALYTSPTCANTASYTTPAQTLSTGAATGTLRPSAGTYYWRATYTPSDSTNLTSTSNCSVAITVAAALGAYSATGTPVTVTTTSTNVVVPYPAGTSAGDLALLVVVNNSAQASTVSAAGWQPVATTSSAGIEMQAWWRTTGDESTVGIAQLPTTASGATAWVIDYKNMPNPVLAGVNSGASATVALTVKPADLTTTAPNATVISLAAVNSARTLSLSTARSFTRRAALSTTGGAGRALGGADRLMATAGAITPPTWSAGALVNWAYITVAFTP